jgi:hypothetical protein
MEEKPLDPNTTPEQAVPPVVPATPEPFWKQIDPTIENEEKAAEVFVSYRDKATELEQKLASIDTTPRYNSTFAKRLDELVFQEVSNGADEATAISRARDYLNAQSRDYEAEAGANAEAILLEKYRKENPGIPDDRLRRVINNRYGIPLRKPGEDATEDEVAAYNEAIDLARTSMEIEARQYGRELNQKKETLGLSPEVKAYRQNLEQQQNALAEFTPKAMAVFKRHASSLKPVVDGIEIDLTDIVAPGGRVDSEFEKVASAFIQGVYNEDGSVNEELAKRQSLQIAMYLNPEKVISKLIKIGQDKTAKEVTDKKLNIVPPGTTQAPVQAAGDWTDSYKRYQQRQGK